MRKKINYNQWENVYLQKGIFHKNEYPSELIISWVKRNYSSMVSIEERQKIKCLDLGCGWGNNLKFLKRELFDTYGIDFSQAAIQSLKNEFADHVVNGDITKLDWADNFFDFVVDKSAIQHNPKEDIVKIFSEVVRVLKSGGKLYSILLKEGDNGFLTGYLDEDELRNSLLSFSDVEINYFTLTENHGKNKFTAYLINATK